MKIIWQFLKIKEQLSLLKRKWKGSISGQKNAPIHKNNNVFFSAWKGYVKKPIVLETLMEKKEIITS